MNSTPLPPLILASTSRYRRELLERLGLAFDVVAPDFDETLETGEPLAKAAARLARGKASAVLERHPDAVVIGSDQIADLDGVPLPKPGTVTNACRQLSAASGRAVLFHTAVCVADRHEARVDTVTTSVKFRVLDPATIARYVERESPLDCAGSARSEGLGIALLEHIDGPDPTALVGLPLIALTTLLLARGFAVV